MAWWSKACFDIQQEYKEISDKFSSKSELKKDEAKLLNEAKKKRDDRLAEATDNAEKRLIEITASLDKLAQASDGGLHYRVKRSAYYIDQFHALVKILNIGGIPTWIAYNSFAERGLKPVFDLIRQTGERLQALRDRLTSVTESIQTSALVVQSSATRENTNVLKNIEWYFKYSSWGLTGWILWLIFSNMTVAVIKKIPSAILDAIKHLLGW
jgi:Mg2+ and Co2+ transporter CorA